MTGETSEREVAIETGGGRVSGLFVRPARPRFLYVFAHGAGAGMRHAFMERAAAELAARDVATLRYQFPYAEAGRKRPDRPAVLMDAVEAAVTEARELDQSLPLVAGGKSMGGRMTSLRHAERPLPGVRGLAFFGFPLHQPGKPGIARAEHLDSIDVPMLFLQGTRDRLADLELMREVTGGLGRRATLHVIDGGDHSFAVLKRSGRTADAVFTELADAFVRFAERL